MTFIASNVRPSTEQPQLSLLVQGRCSAWAAVVLSVLHSTFFLSFQLEFQQPRAIRQNPTGCLPDLSLPSEWPRWTGAGTVEAKDMVTCSNLQVTDIAKMFLPPPSYSIPACDQSCKRLSQVNSSLLWLSLFHGRALNHTYTASIYNKKKKYLQTVFKNQTSITESGLECSLRDSWFNWANLAITSRKKKCLRIGDFKKALLSGKEWGATAWSFVKQKFHLQRTKKRYCHVARIVVWNHLTKYSYPHPSWSAWLSYGQRKNAWFDK